MRSGIVFSVAFLAVLVSTAAGLPGASNILEPADPAGEGDDMDLAIGVQNDVAGASPRVDGMDAETTPTIADFYPVVANRGSTVTAAIVGTGFSPGARVVIAGGGQTINATDCVVMSGSTVITCTLDIPSTAFIGTWDVRVQNPGMTDWVSRAGVLAVQDASTPTITGLSPDPVYRGSIVSMKVNVYGTNFVDGAQVILAGGGQTVEAFEESVEDYGERINCNVFIPTNAYLGPWEIRVKNPGATTWVTKSNAFTVKDTPTITGISPSSAPQGSTVTVTLSGTVFATGIDVCVFAPGFTTIWATNETLINENQVQCTLAIPADAHVGGYFVSIANPGMTYRVESPAGFFTVTPGATPTPTPTPTPVVTATPTPTPTVTEAYEVVKVWGSSGTGPGQFQGPGGIALDPSGNVWVADTGNNRVQKFDRNGTWLSRIGGIESPPPLQLIGPHGIAVNRTGTVYVADTGNNRVRTFDSNGTFLSQIGGGLGGALGQMLGPQGVAVDPAGNVYIADTGNNRTQTFALNGTPLSWIGGLGGIGGIGIGQFMGPAGIAVDNASNVYVADTGNNRVQIFAPNGSYAGQIGAAIGQVAGPQGVAVDNREQRLRRRHGQQHG